MTHPQYKRPIPQNIDLHYISHRVVRGRHETLHANLEYGVVRHTSTQIGCSHRSDGSITAWIDMETEREFGTFQALRDAVNARAAMEMEKEKCDPI